MGQDRTAGAGSGSSRTSLIHPAPFRAPRILLVVIEGAQPLSQSFGVRMRRIGADRLYVDARDDAGLRHDHVDLRIALQVVARGERVVVPEDEDRCLALRDRGGLADPSVAPPETVA